MAGVGPDEIKLTIPARPEFVRLARLAAAGLASRMGFTLDDVEDLRLAIDELCLALTGKEGSDQPLQLTYEVGTDALAVRGEVTGGSPASLSDWSHQILVALVDEHDLSTADGSSSFRLLKRRVVG